MKALAPWALLASLAAPPVAFAADPAPCGLAGRLGWCVSGAGAECFKRPSPWNCSAPSSGAECFKRPHPWNCCAPTSGAECFQRPCPWTCCAPTTGAEPFKRPCPWTCCAPGSGAELFKRPGNHFCPGSPSGAELFHRCGGSHAGAAVPPAVLPEPEYNGPALLPPPTPVLPR